MIRSKGTPDGKNLANQRLVFCSSLHCGSMWKCIGPCWNLIWSMKVAFANNHQPQCWWQRFSSYKPDVSPHPLGTPVIDCFSHPMPVYRSPPLGLQGELVRAQESGCSISASYCNMLGKSPDLSEPPLSLSIKQTPNIAAGLSLSLKKLHQFLWGALDKVLPGDILTDIRFSTSLCPICPSK